MKGSVSHDDIKFWFSGSANPGRHCLLLQFHLSYIIRCIMNFKKALTFLRVFDNSLSKYLILKEFFACNGCFGLFNKIKKEPGTSFCWAFSA